VAGAFGTQLHAQALDQKGDDIVDQGQVISVSGRPLEDLFQRIPDQLPQA